MNIHTENGIAIASFAEPPAPEAPPEHPLRQQIRDLLEALAECTSDYEQTTHGRIGIGGSLGWQGVEGVAMELTRDYREPNAHSISNLRQAIRSFLEEEDGCQ